MYLEWKFHYGKVRSVCVHFREGRRESGEKSSTRGDINLFLLHDNSQNIYLLDAWSLRDSQNRTESLKYYRPDGSPYFFRGKLKCVSVHSMDFPVKAFVQVAGMYEDSARWLRLWCRIEVEIYMKRYFASIHAHRTWHTDILWINKFILKRIFLYNRGCAIRIE